MEIAELVKVGAVAALPAYVAVQAVKVVLASRLEARLGRQRWNLALRATAGLIGLAAGLALEGWPWGAFAGAGGGLAASAVVAALLRAIRAWRPPSGPGDSA